MKDIDFLYIMVIIILIFLFLSNYGQWRTTVDIENEIQRLERELYK